MRLHSLSKVSGSGAKPEKGGPGVIQSSEAKGVGMAMASGSKDGPRYVCGQV